MKEFLEIIWWVILGIITIIWIIIWMEYFVFRMWWIITKHDAARCERAIEYNLTIPYYCNTGSLDN